MSLFEDTNPLNVLKAGAGGFLDWMLKVTDPMMPDERTSMLDAFKKINARRDQGD